MPAEAGMSHHDGIHLDWLAAQYRANRFVPAPPLDGQCVGDGDFKAIGAEFFRHFVRLGGLRPEDAVLDVGCGLGRMALPLTQYLNNRYLGFDIDRIAVAWCQAAVTVAYPEFSFLHLDVANDVYNPGGRLSAAELVFPSRNGEFDFVILTSVFTHLRVEAATHYLREAARVLSPGGRVFATFFLMGEKRRAALRKGGQRIVFDPDAPGPEFIADPEHPAAAVGFSQSWVLETAEAAGLRPRLPVHYGQWCGDEGLSFQDIMIFEKKGTDA